MERGEEIQQARWRKYSYDELAARDKTSLDLFRLKDDSLADLDNLPEPQVSAEEIIDNIEAGSADEIQKTLQNYRTHLNGADSDSTTDLAYTYDRFGRLDTVT